MAGEVRTITVHALVTDTEHLPDGVTPDYVAEQLRYTIGAAVDDFYQGNREWLDVEPDVQ